MSFHDVISRIQHMDARVVRTIMLLAIVIPLANPLPVPLVVTANPQALYDFIEGLPVDSVVLMSNETSAGWRPNLHGTTVAVFAHLMRRGIRVVFNSFTPEGTMHSEQAINDVAVPMGKVYGVDYVHLGYRAGGEGAVAESLRDFHATFTTDYNGTPVEELPLMEQVRTGADLALCVLTSTGGYAGGGWVRQLVEPYGVPLAVNVTGTMAPSHYPYLDAGQIIALMNDTKGGAEYETLIGRPGLSLSIMGAQTFSHLLILLLLAISNVAYLSRKRGDQK